MHLCFPKIEGIPIIFAYIVVTCHAVSLVLVRMENGVQKLVYYVSKLLQETEVCYLAFEKAILAIVHATRNSLTTSRHIPL